MPIAIAENLLRNSLMPAASVLWSDEPELESSLHYQQLTMRAMRAERLAAKLCELGIDLEVFELNSPN